MRDCTCWCGFRRVASRRVLSRFAYPCDLGATQRRRGVRQTDARLLAVAAAADSMIATSAAWETVGLPHGFLVQHRSGRRRRTGLLRRSRPTQASRSPFHKS